MKNRQIDRSSNKKRKSITQIAEDLVTEKVVLILSGLTVLVTVGILIYQTYASDRLEQVFIDQSVIDAPTLLERTRVSVSETRADRHVRGFVRRFVSYYFVHPDDTKEFAERSLRWLHAHTSKMGQVRSEALLREFDSYSEARQDTFNSFFPVNDPSSLKISKSENSDSKFYISQPGTFISKDRSGESFYDASLELVITRSPVSGIPSDLGEINVTGLEVESASITYREDKNRAEELTRKKLF